MRPLAPASICAAAILFSLGACEKSAALPVDAGTNDDGAAFICTVTAPTVCPDPPPHYPDVQPIIQRTCVPCHYGLPGGPWPLLQYSHVADWYDVVRAMVLDCSMPPPDAGVPISDDERTAILTWILCGFPE
jgi:hypothetical protein